MNTAVIALSITAVACIALVAIGVSLSKTNEATHPSKGDRISWHRP